MTRFEQFIKERRYLGNVSERSIEWYDLAFKWLPNENPSDAELKQTVIRMRENGLKARSVNSYRTAINAYLHWLDNSEIKCSPSCSHPRISKLKSEDKILPVYSATDISTFVHWKSKKRCERRLQVIILMLADTGTRISELLGLRWQDVNLDNLLVTVRGKGDKQRTIPFSLELRKHLFKLKVSSKSTENSLVFATHDGGKLGRRNVLRDVKLLCKKLNVRIPERSIHAFRHSFAVNYIRKSGSPFLLQRALGHTTLDMTKKYVNLMTEDLSAIHQRVSLLSS
jgi:integrase/recombinase XerD